MGKHRAPTQRPVSRAERQQELLAAIDPVRDELTRFPALPAGARRVGFGSGRSLTRRGENLRLTGVIGAVVAATVGLANLVPGGHPGSSVVMASIGGGDGAGSTVLHGIDTQEALPWVPTVDALTPDEPRQVDGPDPLPDPTPAAATTVAPVVVSATASRGIPGQVLAAYQAAAATMAKQDPACHLPWALLAGIGRIESGQAANGALDATGRALRPIVGPALNGAGGFARVLDTDHGVWDGDTVYDRAVGPMQFLPGTWRAFGRDGNGDGKADPENISDAALTTASYLCAGGGDLSTRLGLLAAVYRYNRSWQYVSTVLTWAGIYATGTPIAVPTPTSTATPKPTQAPTSPPTSAPTPTPTPTSPTQAPTAPPSATPTPTPSDPATGEPTAPPTSEPTTPPTSAPSNPPAGPTATPTPTAGTEAPAATGELSGKVVDALGSAIGAVTVTLHGPTARTVVTAADGTWSAADLAAGTWTVTVVAPLDYLLPAASDQVVPLTAGASVTVPAFTLTKIAQTPAAS